MAGGGGALPEISPNPFPDPVATRETYTEHIFGSIDVRNAPLTPRGGGNGNGSAPGAAGTSLGGGGAGGVGAGGVGGGGEAAPVTVLKVRKKRKPPAA